jgi:hypothetical protein
VSVLGSLWRRIRRSRWLTSLFIAAVLLLLAIPGGGIYYAVSGDALCIKCHEVRPAHEQWLNSSHRGVQCKECHGSLFTSDTAFHLNNVRQLWKHAQGEVPERLLLSQKDISRGLNERCAKCHSQEFAAWRAGPHSARYAAVFLNEKHNHSRLPTDHCLQCHGMFFETGIRDLIAPLDSKGPWHWMAAAELREQASIPCVACHQIHREGRPLGAVWGGAGETNGAKTAVYGKGLLPEGHRPSLAFYDRREQMHFSVDILPLPALHEGSRSVVISPDRRQALCYQCHAPDHTMEAGSGDDRTCRGVHEGLNCLACHQKHQMSAADSCANCHPKLSNCGLPVEAMDTTFKSPQSQHNIHSVKCIDCHTGGVPQKQPKLKGSGQ